MSRKKWLFRTFGADSKYLLIVPSSIFLSWNNPLGKKQRHVYIIYDFTKVKGQFKFQTKVDPIVKTYFFKIQDTNKCF